MWKNIGILLSLYLLLSFNEKLDLFKFGRGSYTTDILQDFAHIFLGDPIIHDDGLKGMELIPEEFLGEDRERQGIMAESKIERLESRKRRKGKRLWRRGFNFSHIEDVHRYRSKRG